MNARQRVCISFLSSSNFVQPRQINLTKCLNFDNGNPTLPDIDSSPRPQLEKGLNSYRILLIGYVHVNNTNCFLGVVNHRVKLDNFVKHASNILAQAKMDSSGCISSHVRRINRS